MEGVIEIHMHTTCTASDRQGWYCGFVYMDGKQCTTTWAEFPHFPGNESRVMTREDIREWVKAGGAL